MSANHLSRQAVDLPATPQNWPQFMKYLCEEGYRLSFWAQIDFPSVVPSYYVGLESANGFRKASRVTDVREWLPACVTALYRDALAYEQTLKKTDEAAAPEEAKDGSTQTVLDTPG